MEEQATVTRTPEEQQIFVDGLRLGLTMGMRVLIQAQQNTLALARHDKCKYPAKCGCDDFLPAEETRVVDAREADSIKRLMRLMAIPVTVDQIAAAVEMPFDIVGKLVIQMFEAGELAMREIPDSPDPLFYLPC